jgi:ribosomal protein S18 acetylase RimI-like enzyme
LPVARAEANLLRACGTWAAAAEGGWTWEAPGLFAAGCSSGQRSFNQVFVTAPDPDRSDLMRAISQYAATGGRFRLRLRDDLHESVRGTVESAGLERHGGIPTMTFSGELADSGGTGFRIEPVVDESRLTDHVNTVAEAFDWSPQDLRRVFTPALLSDPEWTAFVGYEDGVSVTTAQLVVHHGVAGLYYVATVKAARRKGYGEAITRHAVREGQAHGCDLVSLQASPAGFSVYQRMGFEVVGEYVTYVPSEHA